MDLYGYTMLIAYLFYNVALGMSLAFHAMSDTSLATVVVVAVVAMHFLLGILSTLRDGWSAAIEERFGILIGLKPPSMRWDVSFRHSVAGLADGLLVTSLVCGIVVLYVDSDEVFWYALAISTAIVGNWLCNLLHAFPAGF
jgi:hypothetical protein